jgi:lysophospholipase L1-like esterase
LTDVVTQAVLVPRGTVSKTKSYEIIDLYDKNGDPVILPVISGDGTTLDFQSLQAGNIRLEQLAAPPSTVSNSRVWYNTTIGAIQYFSGDDIITVSGATSGILVDSPLFPVGAAIANRDTNRVDIGIIGDSITEGEGADNVGNTYVHQANRAIRQIFPTKANGSNGGLGFIPVQSTGEESYDWPIVLASGSVTYDLDLGPVRVCPGFSTQTAVWTFTAPAGTTGVRICYYDGSVPGGVNWKIDSGSNTRIYNTGALIDAVSDHIALTEGQVLTVSATSDTAAFFTGLIHYAGDESSGITFHDFGHFGWCAGTETNGWNQPEIYSLDWTQVYKSILPDLKMLLIALGVNDGDTTDANKTGAEFAEDLTAFVETIRTSPGAPALATIPLGFIRVYQPGITLADPKGWDAYLEAMHTVAAADGNAVVFDMAPKLPVNNAEAPFFPPGDSYHGSNYIYALMGEILAAQFRIQ